MLAKRLTSRMVLSLFRYHTEGSKMTLNALLTAHITTHSIYLSFFVCDFFCVLNFRLSAVSLLSVANSHVALVALHSLRWCIFIWRQFYLFIFTLYDLSMWWHNKGFNEFDSLPFAALSFGFAKQHRCAEESVEWILFTRHSSDCRIFR